MSSIKHVPISAKDCKGQCHKIPKSWFFTSIVPPLPWFTTYRFYFKFSAISEFWLFALNRQKVRPQGLFLVSTTNWDFQFKFLTISCFLFLKLKWKEARCNVNSSKILPQIYRQGKHCWTNTTLWRLPTPLLNPLQHGEYVPSVHSSMHWKCTVILLTPLACIYSCVYVINV